MNDPDYLEELELKYEGIIKKDPKNNSFVLLAEVLLKRKKFDKAVKVLVNGLLHNKHNVTARFLLGKIYYDRWMIVQAKKEFERIIDLAPDNLAVAKILIEIYKSEENFKRALEIANRLLYYFSGSEDIEKIINELESLSNKKDLSTSIDNEYELSNIKKTTLKTPDLVSETLADLYYKQGHYSESIAMYNEILAANPTNMKVIEKIRQEKRILKINT